MDKKQTGYLVNNVIFWAAIAGLALTLLLWLVGFIKFDAGFGFNGLYFIHKQFPGYWLIDFLPFFAAWWGYKLSKTFVNPLQTYQEQLSLLEHKNQKVHQFVNRLLNEDTQADFQPENANDKLGYSLITLRNNLSKKTEESNLRKKEDDQRNWISEGLARFSEMLRTNNNDIKQLSTDITSGLVKYLNANQGGFFLFNDNPKHRFFEQTACYAYDRNKFADKIIEWGEGLIGTCALERKTIFMTNIPDDYISITSGLGKANPNSLLIVPLIFNEELHGVIELASFKKFDKFEIEFVERVAESIASTLSSVKINARTADLLKESQQQAEILAVQEERMRQNMHELEAAQEEAARQSEKFVNFANSVNHTLIRAEYQPDGTLMYANAKFLQKLNYTHHAEVAGKHISMFVNKKDREWFDPIWEGLSKGKKHFEGDMKLVTKLGQDLWTMATLTTMLGENNTVDKILFLAIDTTEQKIQSLDFEAQLDALNRSSMKAEFSPEGHLLNCNSMFEEMLKFSVSEMKEMLASDFIVRNDFDKFRKMWKEVITGKPFSEQYQYQSKQKDIYWFRGTYSAVFDMYGDVSKVIFIGTDATKEKIMEIESQQQNEQLRIQEEKLRQAGEELSKKLEEARAEMRKQFKEIEKVKLRNERTLEGALDAIVTINTAGLIEFFNNAAEELWGIPKKDAMGNNAQLLFSADTLQNDEFAASLVNPKAKKLVGVRKEVNITNSSGDDIPVLVLVSAAEVDGEETYTAFIQNIEVELF